MEITDINKEYMRQGRLHVENFGRGFAWLDTGTYDSLMDAGQFVQTIEHRQGFKVACLEEIACRNNWINAETLIKYGTDIKSTDYGEYLIEIGKEMQ